MNERVDDIRDLRVLIWACGKQERFASPHVYREAKKQGLNVDITFDRSNPQLMAGHVRNLIAANNKPHWIFNFAIQARMKRYYEWLSRQEIKQLWWYPDQCESSRIKMWNTLKGKPDAVVFSILHAAQYFKHHAPHVLWVPQYFDAERCKRGGQLPPRLDPRKPIYDLCFIGACDARRKRWVSKLVRKFNCNFSTHAMGKLNEVRGWDMAEAYAQSKIAFNIQREIFLRPGPFITSNRVYNAMGSGCFFINHYVNQMELLWEEGVHCVTYNDSYEELDAKIRFWLAPENEEKREEIARAGQQDILTYHTLERRIPQYWRIMQAIQNGETSELQQLSFEHRLECESTINELPKMEYPDKPTNRLQELRDMRRGRKGKFVTRN